MGENLTIVLPTRNRPGLLRRSLDFYARHGFSYKIAVADSSDSVFHDEMDGLAREFPELSLEIKRFPADFNSWLKIIEVMEEQDTDYIGLSGDDDILLNAGVAEGIDFLDANPSVSVVDGREFRVALPSPLLLTYWGFTVIGHQQNSAVSVDPMNRLVEYFQSYWPTFYGIHRRASVIEAFRTAYEMNTENLASELMQGAVTVLNGGYHCIDAPYIIRQVYHNQSTAFSSWSEIVESTEFQQQVEYFRKKIQEKFPSDERVPGACDLAFDRFLKSMLPEYEFLSSKVAVDNGNAAADLQAKLMLDDDMSKEAAQILTPEDVRRLVAENDLPILLEAVHLMTKCPDGIAQEVTGAALQDRMISSLSDDQKELISWLCFDGFSDVILDLFNYVSKNQRLVTYQTIDLLFDKNHYTLPSVSACVFVANMALLRDNADACIEQIRVMDNPRANIIDLIRPHNDKVNQGDKLDEVCRLFLHHGSGQSQDLAAVLMQGLNDEEEDASLNAVLLVVFSTVAAVTDQVGEVGDLFAQIVPDLELPICQQVPLLAEFARISFSELQTSFLIETDWRNLLEASVLATPEGIFWASKYAAALYAAGEKKAALEVKDLLEAVLVDFEGLSNSEGSAAITRSEGHWLPHKEWIEKSEKSWW